jgi:hypothetical protein
MIAEGYKIQMGEINNSDNSSSSCSKKPCTIVSFRLDEEQYLYLKRIAGVMYQKGFIKSSNIGALSKLVTLYVGDTYPDIEKQITKRQRKISKKRGLLKRLLVNGRDDDFFNVF